VAVGCILTVVVHPTIARIFSSGLLSPVAPAATASAHLRALLGEELSVEAPL
jgi:hypothetical protein